MNILCRLFGHRSLEGVHSGAEYMEIIPTAVDGILREHAILKAVCPRCHRAYIAGATHRPRDWSGLSEAEKARQAKLPKEPMI